MSTVAAEMWVSGPVGSVPSTAVRSTTARRAAARSRLRMTKRGRAVLLMIVAAPVVVLALFFGINAGGATATTSSTPLQTITMPAGESLWQVATEIAPKADPRDFIADVVSVNQLSSTNVQPGQTLEIPAKYEH
ncbi:MAG: hypothetical protein JWQ47_1190 [Glaciihabitans sp.]|nr:hypothetical protein [Glaciihabitans sp.]MDQ1572949.1 hypothetical protein [Actinomycetota bacterium]